MSSISVLGITCLSASFTQLNMMTSLLIILFLLNLASAVQDICVDSLALEVLEPGELGAGNTIQVVAYKAGSVFAGALLLWVKEVGSWSLMWTSFSCLYLLCLLLILSLELGYKNKTKNNLKTAEDKSDKSSSEPSLTINFLLQNWKRLLEVPGQSLIRCFASIIYVQKITWGIYFTVGFLRNATVWKTRTEVVLIIILVLDPALISQLNPNLLNL